jgi:formiminotetrahydrofolate cyclodeaminase
LREGGNTLLANLRIVEFFERTASSAPVPGGGSIAALSAAASASLSEMVANLTIGKKGYETIENDMKEIARNAFNYRGKIVQDIDRDSDAFNDVVSAYRLPKDTEEDRRNRNRAIQDGLKNAAIVPLSVAKDAFKLMELAGELVRNANKAAVTDAAVAAMMARTAVLSALYNVKINLVSITDKAFVIDVTKQVEHMEKETEKREKEILSAIDRLLPKQKFI